MDNLNSKYFKSLYKELEIIADIYRLKYCNNYYEFFISKIVEINIDENYFAFIIRHKDQSDNLKHHRFKMNLNLLDEPIEHIKKYIDNDIKATNKLFNKSIMNTPLSIIKDEKKPISHIFFGNIYEYTVELNRKSNFV